MFEQDYLMRMIVAFAAAIRRSMEKANGEQDPESAARLLEEAISAASEMDAAMLLSLAPDSFAGILSVSGTDPLAVEYIARSLLLEADYLCEAGDSPKAGLRRGQAEALVRAFGIELGDDAGSSEGMEGFLERTTRPLA